jgi:stearoyl-CoA desaturase (delta-9 desaturase)
MKHVIREIINWFDSYSVADDFDEQSDRIEVLRIMPFIIIHASVLLVFWVGFSWVACITALVLYVVRMFAITAFYHRYFSHRAFKTSRSVQFLFAFLGNAAAQRGPLWWAAHHRHHHRYTDQPEDTHSPVQYGFLWSHLLWFLANKNFRSHTERIKDYCIYPELVFIDRFDALAPLGLLFLLIIFGVLLDYFFPGLHTNGLQMAVWGFSISTVAVYHATFTINSLAHMFGSQRYDTGDFSRNNPLLAILTLGEGWHNNHHHYASAARQGFFWWEFDCTFYFLKLLSWLGIVHHLKALPEKRRLLTKPSS